MLTRAEFEARLKASGVVPTARYSADGRTRMWHKPDGVAVTIPVYDHYPEYILDKFLEHFRIAYLPLYNSNQA